ncbi:hypothetical protein EDC01DRAFT_492090 [Geopyxis carbonaria]|nr:hypothetical protein EDC01DRAFT_492090 [Geopyxis carbonaria]
MRSWTVLTIALGVLCSSTQALLVPRTKACTALEKKFPNDVSFPGEVSYSDTNTYWASNTALTPPCIFTPRTSAAAAAALPILVAHNSEFAIRGGGHSMNRGFSSTATGVLISMSKLTTIDVSDDRQTVRLGAGLRWGAVYTTLEAQGLSVPGGRAANVGVGGLSLGGGLSFFLYELGFGCDNIIAYTVALADGRLLRVTADTHADIFLALKGSGAPFAVVTEFTYRAVELHPSGQIWGGFLTAAGSAKGALLDGVATFLSPTGGVTDKDTHLIAVVALAAVDPLATLTPITITTLAINILFHRDPTLTSPPAAFAPQYAAYNSAPLQSTVEARTLSSLTDEIDAVGQGFRQLMWPLTVSNPSPALLRALERAWREAFTPMMLLAPGVSATLNFIPVGSAVGTPETNLMGLDNSGAKRYLIIEIYAQWLLPLQDGQVRAATKRANAAMVKLAQEAGSWERWVYLNYADKDQDPIASYGGHAAEVIRAAQREVDPTGVWSRLVKGGFKV